VKDEHKTKEELIKDLLSLRRKITKLEKSEPERKRIEESLLETEGKFKSLAQQSPNMIFINKKGRIRYVNDKCVEIMGYTKEEFCSPDFDFLKLIAPESIDVIKTRFNKHMKGEEIPPYEYTIITKEGLRIAAIITTKLVDFEGEKAILGIVTDVTAQKRVEEELRVSEERYRKLVENASVGIIVAQDGMAKFANPQITKIIEYTLDEIFSTPFLEFIHPDDRQMVMDIHHKRLEGELTPESYEVRIIDKDSKIKWLEIAGVQISWVGKPASLNFVKDITGRKEVEEALRNSEERLALAVEASGAGVYDHAVPLGPETYHSERWMDILGYKREELPPPERFMEWVTGLIHPDDVQKLNETYSDFIEGKTEKYDIEFRIQNKSGEWVYVHSLSRAVERYEQGAVKRIVGVMLDITERKKAEREKQDLREKLINAQRMEAIAVLAGGVAHDLNNVLGPLVAYPQMMRMNLEPEDPIRKNLERIEKSALRAAAIVQDLLTLARRGRYELAPIDLNELIESYLQSIDYSRAFSRYQNINIRLLLDNSIPKSNGSSTHLYKVIMNLIINALDAMPNGGNLAIKTECKYIDRIAGGFANIEPGKYNIITVSDSGIGINKKDLPRVFEPFYSKKKLGRSGSGLGLAIVYGVVKDHNGYIDVTSEPDKGSSFYIYLPIIEYDIVENDVKESVDIRGNEKILVVDDVAEQRELAATILSSLGYQMETVTSGEDAIEYFKKDNADVVILDMIMDPGIDGLDTYRKIIELHPGQQAIISTGFSETDRVKEAERIGVGKVIKKPYTMQMLATAIRDLVDNKNKIPLVENVV
jgi:PAS domain S-box-containing protein